ncbi:MAG: hypothetical protein AB1439_03045 [candidate division FCPU426 bacterium]
MSRKWHGIAWVMLVSLLSGCVTIGRPVPWEAASQIVVGKTTRAEIEQRLGPPYRTGLDSGNPSVTYLHYRLGLFSQPITTDLTVVYMPDGLVKSYTFNTNQSQNEEE